VGRSDTLTRRLEFSRPLAALVASAGAGAGGTGRITGVVLVGDRPQPRLGVYLYDLAKRVVGQTTTDAKGAFSFEDLEPKRYQLFCENRDGITNRKGDREVTVDAGQTVKVTLELVQ
jgi:hypothetical protein